MKRQQILMASVSLFGAALAGLPAHAQAPSSGVTALEEVVVTAERRTADVQKTAAAVSVRTGDELERQGKFTLNQILENVPGVSGQSSSGISNTGTDSPETGIAIRGVRTNSTPLGLPTAATTALYVDGVFGGVGGSYDIDRVEVLRGPQGTLYGRSATGGVISTYTRNPDAGEFAADLSAELGSYELRRFTGAVNVPIVADKLALRISANSYEREGYDHPEGGNANTKDARVKALWTPTEDISLLLGFALQDNEFKQGGVLFRATGPGTYVKDSTAPVGSSETSFRQYWAQLDWNLGGMTLTYLPALRTYEQTSSIFAVAPAAGYYKQSITEPDDTYVTHEVHLTSAPDSKLVWQVGAIYFQNEVKNFVSQNSWQLSGAFVNRRTISRTVTDVGVFAEGTYPVLEHTRVTVGLRYDEDKIRTNATLLSNNNRALRPGTATAGLPEANVLYSVTGQQGASDFAETTYKLRLEHDFTDQNMAYAMVSTAFIPGDVQIASTIPPIAYRYTAEKLTAYEAGTKNRFMDGRLQVNAAAFLYDYAGYQTSVTPNPADPSVQYLVVTPARMIGVELETLFQITADDLVGMDIGYIDAHWVDAPASFRASVYQKEITNISPTTVNVFYDHTFHLDGGSTLRFHADARYRAGYDVASVSPAFQAQGALGFVRVDDVVLGNLSLDWSSPGGRYGVTGYVRNVGDERYFTGALLQGVVPPNGTYSLSEPRTYGLVVRANF